VVHGGWHQATKNRAKQLNDERESYIKQFRGRWCSAVLDRLDDSMAQIILDPAQPDLLIDPDKLYKSIMQRVVGGTAAEIGPRVFRDAQDIKWQDKGADGSALTLVQQVDLIINKYRAVAARFAAINDGNYSMTEAAMVAAATMRAPTAFDTSAIASFESCTDLSALQVEMQRAARRIDERAPTGLNAFVASASTEQNERLDRIEATLATTLAMLTKSGGGGTRTGNGFSKERLFDEEAGPPRRGMRYCTKHGWQRHSSERCYTLHPELAPAGWVHK
jgi:hypothetical protein